MSGETEKAPSGWTVDTLKEYVDTLRQTDKEAVNAALAASDKAAAKKESADDRRFESVNEFRQTLSDQAQLFLTRTEYDTAHDNLVERVTDITNRLNLSTGKGQGYSAVWLAGVAGVSLIIAIVVAANAVFSR